MALDPGVVLQDRYRLDEQLCVGGQGILWRGHDLRLKRDVAIKFMLGPASDPALFKRFEREAQIAAGLEHPGITTVYDFGSHEDQFFIVMQLLRGRDLREILKEQLGGLPVAEAVELALQMLEALAVPHERGVVHRDLKPANLFVLSGNKIKICDFGIAKTADATRITPPDQIIGTPAYMSPEQWSGKDVGPGSDLYSMGCVLYEMLTGQPPFRPDQMILALMAQHLSAPPTPPQGKAAISQQLRDFVLRLLAKSPEERGTTAADLATELRKIDLMAGTPVKPQYPPVIRTRPTRREPRYRVVSGVQQAKWVSERQNSRHRLPYVGAHPAGRPDAVDGRLHCGPLELILHRQWDEGTVPPVQVIAAVSRLASLPRHLQEKLAIHLTAIFVGPGGVPDLDDMGALKGIPLPSGKATWDAIAGAYGDRKIVVGSLRPLSPTPDVMCHEVGHALDDLDAPAGKWQSDFAEFRLIYDRCNPHLRDDYHRQRGGLGRKEFYADAFAAIASGQRPALADMLSSNDGAALPVMRYFNQRYGI